MHCAGQIRIIELVGVVNLLVQRQLKILAAERMAVTGREVRERHPEGAANPCIQMMNLAGEAIGRQPFGQGIGIQKRAVDALGLGAENTVKPDGTGGHDGFAF